MPGSIVVVNKKNHKPCACDYYIGRPSVLGNQWSHLSLPHTIKVSTRHVAVGSYERWLYAQLTHSDNARVKREIESLFKKYTAGETIHLVCWCAPLACHGDVVKQTIEDMTKVIDLYKGEDQ